MPRREEFSSVKNSDFADLSTQVTFDFGNSAARVMPTHPLPDPPPQLVAIRDVGAYGRSMASSYNARALAAEVFVSGGEVIAVRHARPIDDVVAEELGAAIAPR